MKDATRKLAAIMFTDIVGYSALSHQDEALALSLLQEHRAVVRPCLAEYQGREIKTIGDAFMVEFANALGAVRCAEEIQRRLHQYRLRSAGRGVQVRIAIHLCDVVASEGDVYGDGVNTASRLLSLAGPGEICVSKHVADQVRSLGKWYLRPIGSRRLKGIRSRVPAYLIAVGREHSWLGQCIHAYQATLISHRSARLLVYGIVALIAFLSLPKRIAQIDPTENERVAVLPFGNLSAERDDEYLSEGITEEVISSLSGVNGPRVIARSSVNQYRNTQKPISEIASELKVGKLVEGTLKRQGDRIRVAVSLIDARTQENLWTESWEGKVSDAFAIQKRIAEKVAKQFRGRMLASVPSGGPSMTQSPGGDAYLSYLRGKFFMNKRTRDGLDKGIEYFKKAIELDDHLVAAYAGVANSYGLLAFYGHMPPRKAAEIQMPLLGRALGLDPGSAEALVSLAEKKAYVDHDWKGAEESFRDAIRSQPSFATAHQWYAEFLTTRGRMKEAKAELAQALELDPLSLAANTAVGLPEYFGRNYARAIEQYKRTLELDPGFVLPHYWISRALIETGRYREAVASAGKAMELSQGAPMMKAAWARALAFAGQREKARAVLGELESARRSGAYVSPYDLAAIHASLGEEALAIDELERSYQERSNHIAFLAVDPTFDQLRSHPRFQGLLARIR